MTDPASVAAEPCPDCQKAPDGLGCWRHRIDSAGYVPTSVAAEEALSVNDLHAADVAASLVHDYIWQKPVLAGPTPPSKEQASDAIWTIHKVLRPLIATLDAARSGPASPGLDVEALRAEIEAELELVPRCKRPQFDAGAAAAYSFVLSLLPPPAARLTEKATR